MAIAAGSIQAECYLGQQLIKGEGVEKDVQKGIKMIEHVIEELGLEEAMYILAEIYSGGIHVERSVDKAMDLYRRAIDQGFAEACYGLGRIYRDDECLHNDQAAFETFLKGAEMKDLDCMTEAIRMYREGIGTEMSEERAVFWEGRYTEQDGRIHPYEW